MGKKKHTLDTIAIVISILALASSFYTFYYQTIHISEKSLMRINQFDLKFEKSKMNFELEVGLINHGNTDILLEELGIEVTGYDSSGNLIGSYRYQQEINEVVGVKKIHLRSFSEVAYVFWNPSNEQLNGLNAYQRLLLNSHFEGTVSYKMTGGNGSRVSGKIEGLKFDEIHKMKTIELSINPSQPNDKEIPIESGTSGDSTRLFQHIKVDESFQVNF